MVSGPLLWHPGFPSCRRFRCVPAQLAALSNIIKLHSSHCLSPARCTFQDQQIQRSITAMQAGVMLCNHGHLNRCLHLHMCRCTLHRTAKCQCRSVLRTSHEWRRVSKPLELRQRHGKVHSWWRPLRESPILLRWHRPRLSALVFWGQLCCREACLHTSHRVPRGLHRRRIMMVAVADFQQRYCTAAHPWPLHQELRNQRQQFTRRRGHYRPTAAVPAEVMHTPQSYKLHHLLSPTVGGDHRNSCRSHA
mmetsp:Transcript_115883/g.368450  ORF Transcript_115883/g.368450 Transcript_115883/m.368450 type:complete len:249 (+) Transcript_115883:1203-1949(+)